MATLGHKVLTERVLHTDGCLDVTLWHLAFISWISFQTSQHCKLALLCRITNLEIQQVWSTEPLLCAILGNHSDKIIQFLKQCIAMAFFGQKVSFWWKVLLHYIGSSFPPMIIIIVMCYYSIRPICMPGPAFAMTTLWAISNIERVLKKEKGRKPNGDPLPSMEYHLVSP